MKRKIAAILAADVVGYSRLVAEDENRALEHLLACREVFAEFVERGGGRIFNTAGDAVLAEFPSAVEALLAGIDIQDCLHTHYLNPPDGFRMQFRMGMTIGDVVERDGDLLGDGVNVAARLEGLAAPGGICISGIMHEQVLNKVSARFRDVGMKSVKNIPSPIHVYALDGAAAAGRSGHWTAETRRRSAILAGVVIATLTAGAVLKLGLHRSGTADAAVAPTATSADTPKTGIYGVSRPATKASLPSPPRPFDPGQTPFVSDGNRLWIAKVLSDHGPNTALALSLLGGFGLVWDRPTVEKARDDALNTCAADRRGECTVYAVDGQVSWPRPIPLPSKPWVDPAVARTPFDVSRLRGFSDAERMAVQKTYLPALGSKALALGPDGTWYYRGRRSSDDEAVRTTLEYCGDQLGVACRIVAINDQFVVEDTSGPVGIEPDDEKVCEEAAGAPYDTGSAKERPSFAEIDPSGAIPACRKALASHPSEASLQVSLARAIDRSAIFPEDALGLYRAAASKGDPAALNILGMAYDGGRLGLTQDLPTAVSLYQQAADLGDPNGTRNLALMYLAGRGVPRDSARASILLKHASELETAWRPKPR